ncbi:hypothetical protein Cgig2_026320 [Carnegiea gigantea]|uniref:C2 domain-containing protein n=1 Tax=Carnegiea gigantea TaxID=171969 RepID=A0A9Q1KEN3_9CARY|nr:hypothetical protein Cgig2_026320 [Carnegiea gigantea]
MSSASLVDYCGFVLNDHDLLLEVPIHIGLTTFTAINMDTQCRKTKVMTITCAIVTVVSDYNLIGQVLKIRTLLFILATPIFKGFLGFNFLLMEEGILEVLLVNAKGIRHTNLIGASSLFMADVNQLIMLLYNVGLKSKKARLHQVHRYQHKAFWNEKFKFKLPSSEWKNLTHLQISIMNAKHFKKNGGFVGQTIIFIGGIIAEGNDKGHIELHPSSYNVVLEDTTYKGEIKIGLKFKVNKEGCRERERQAMQVTGARRNHLLTNCLRCLKMSWWKVFCPYGQSCHEDDKKA